MRDRFRNWSASWTLHRLCWMLQSVPVPAERAMKGRSFLPLLRDANARSAWPNRQLIQISESMTGRAILNAKDWTYCVADPVRR